MKITLISPSFMRVKTRSVGKLARFFKVPPMGLQLHPQISSSPSLTKISKTSISTVLLIW